MGNVGNVLDDILVLNLSYIDRYGARKEFPYKAGQRLKVAWKVAYIAYISQRIMPTHVGNVGN